MYWFILVVFVAQMYNIILMGAIPVGLLAEFINFVLNPATVFLKNISIVDTFLIPPIANTLNVIWQYLLGTILAKEISKDKE